MLPSLPPFAGIHPLVVHLPIGLLAVVPLFLLAAALLPRRRPGFSLSAAILMGLGAVGAWVAVATGQAAARIADKTPAVLPVLRRHAEFGERVRLVFSILALLYLLALGVNHFLERRGRPIAPRLVPVGRWTFLLVYVAALWLLVWVGDLGAHLVHEFGLQALVGTLH